MEMGLVITLAAVLLCTCIVLPIVAIVRTSRIRDLEARLAGVEAALRRVMLESATGAREAASQIPAAAPPLPDVTMRAPGPEPEVLPPVAPVPRENLEAMIGQKWTGWVAMVLIFCAVAFFLKYAFENQWIGELGRVTLGVITGLVFECAGLDRHRKGWRHLSQVLTGGGITILYLWVYGAFG